MHKEKESGLVWRFMGIVQAIASNGEQLEQNMEHETEIAVMQGLRGTGGRGLNNHFIPEVCKSYRTMTF